MLKSRDILVLREKNRDILVLRLLLGEKRNGSSGFRVGTNPAVRAIHVERLGDCAGFSRRGALGGRDQQDPQVPPPKPPTPFPSSPI